MTSKEANQNDKPVSKKVKTKNRLRGDDPNDDPTQRSILVEQTFSFPING